MGARTFDQLSTERGPARLDLFTVLALGVSKV